jgi:hypothetical protein
MDATQKVTVETQRHATRYGNFLNSKQLNINEKTLNKKITM